MTDAFPTNSNSKPFFSFSSRLAFTRNSSNFRHFLCFCLLVFVIVEFTDSIRKMSGIHAAAEWASPGSPAAPRASQSQSKEAVSQRSHSPSSQFLHRMKQAVIFVFNAKTLRQLEVRFFRFYHDLHSKITFRIAKQKE